MSRTPLLTTLLWTTAVGTAALVGCGDDGVTIVDAAGPDGAADAQVGPLAQFPATLDLSATCGEAMPATVDITVSNVGNSPLSISGATATGGFTVTTTFPIEVAAGASTTVAIRPPAAVIGTDLGGSTKTGVLSFATNQPGTTGTVTLTSTIQGANLVFENVSAAAITSVDLTAQSGCPAPAFVFIHNTGNLEARLNSAFASGNGFTVSGFTPSSTVGAGSTVSHEVRPFTTNSCTYTDNIQYQVTGPICQTTPLALQANFNVAGQSSCFCS